VLRAASGTDIIGELGRVLAAAASSSSARWPADGVRRASPPDRFDVSGAAITASTYQYPLRCRYDARMPEDRCDLLCLDLPKAEALRASRLSDAASRTFAKRSKALSDPTRLTIAAALADTDELCVCDLAWVTERPDNLVSHHLRTLRGAGLVTGRRDGKMVMYSVTDAGRAFLSAVRADVEAAR
jgi:DNA-binding transcriptional ArsR family regulator